MASTGYLRELLNDGRRNAPAIINSMPALLTSVPILSTSVPLLYIRMDTGGLVVLGC